MQRKKKVFISYSWIPEDNKVWVKKLVKRLENDGIEVVIDYNSLKLGQDKYAFIERMVNDTDIDKVLIICNKTYKEYADSRYRDIGTAATIITSQIYGDEKQEKFIPVVNEYNENNEPYLPSYMLSRMYADLTNFEEGYKELLENIWGESLKEDTKIDESYNDIDRFDTPTDFFSYRMKLAFPEINGLMEFTNPHVCIDRLENLLRKPLITSRQGISDPIWWIGARKSDCINKFSILTQTKFLMNLFEIEIKKLIVYLPKDCFKSFVYVEVLPEKSVLGANKKHIDKVYQRAGEYYEEYVIFNNKIFSPYEYNSINVKESDINNDAIYRIHYLAPYNFIICAKWNPINTVIKHNVKYRIILNDILKGKQNIENIISLIGDKRHYLDM